MAQAFSLSEEPSSAPQTAPQQLCFPAFGGQDTDFLGGIISIRGHSPNSAVTPEVACLDCAHIPSSTRLPGTSSFRPVATTGGENVSKH